MSRLMDELTGENHVHDDAPTDDTPDVAATPAIVVPGDDVDLDEIAAGLDAVAAALQRLDDGSYGIDHVTGQPIDDAVLATDPTATRTP